MDTIDGNTFKATQAQAQTNMDKIIINTDGSKTFSRGGLQIKSGKLGEPEIIEVPEGLDFDKAVKDKKYVNDLVSRSTIKEKKHGT